MKLKAKMIFTMILAGLLLSVAHHFRYEDFSFSPGWLNFIIASLGIGLLLKMIVGCSSFRERFVYALIAAFINYSIVLYWIVVALKEFGELPLYLSILIACSLWIYCALYVGLWAGIAGSAHVQSQSIGLRLWIWASSFAGLEAIRETLFTGFSWGELGFHFSHSPLIAKSASIWGVHGLTFFWVFAVSSLWFFSEWRYQRLTRRFVLSSWGLMIAVILYGNLFSFRFENARDFRIALIQPNIQQDVKWSSDKASQHLETLVQMTSEASLSSPDLIVWPETAYPFLVQLNQKQFPFSSSIPVLVGAVVGDRGINRNSVLLLEGQATQSRYDKIHLVPFGEFVPFEEWMPFEKLVANVGRFVRGSEEQQPLELTQSKLKMGPLICYEDVFAQHSVRHASRGAQILVNVTNDAWYGKSSALKQHADIASFQVMSTGLPMVRATNTGISSVITTQSRQDFPDYEQKNYYVSVPVQNEPAKSFFVRTFPLMQWIWWLLFVIALLWKFRDPTRKIFYNKSLK